MCSKRQVFAGHFHLLDTWKSKGRRLQVLPGHDDSFELWWCERDFTPTIVFLDRPMSGSPTIQ
jgi:hypothetical protein